MLCEIDQLNIVIHAPDGSFHDAVSDFSLQIEAGRTTALVGESGAGKTLVVRALLGLLPAGVASVKTGAVRWQGREIWRERGDKALRGRHIAAVFQDPGAALNPVFSVGDQIVSAIRAHRKIPRATARTEALDWLKRVGIEDAARRFGAYPHELSGGEKQRAAIAAALVHDPELLVADEPTSALDLPIQREILALLRERQAERGTAILLVSHDLSLVDEFADQIVVVFAGRVMESFPRGESALHPYTRQLRAASFQKDPVAEDAHTEQLIRLVPGPGQRPAGCVFQSFCDRAEEACRGGKAPQAEKLSEVGGAIRSLACPPEIAALRSAGGGA